MDIKRLQVGLVFFLLLFGLGSLQGQHIWYDVSEFALEGQAWPGEVMNPYDRLPKRAKEQVREVVWRLSEQSAGLKLSFDSQSPEIWVRYGVKGNIAMPHMPATGVSGLDLYALKEAGNWAWCRGNYSFGDTLYYKFSNLAHAKSFHLYFPLYNAVEWMQIGVPIGESLAPLSPRGQAPICIYGTSIAQGACASRPGMAWPAILERSMNQPVINLGFSGNGRLEPELLTLIGEIEASVYILDCLPNLTRMPLDSVYKRVVSAVTYLRNTQPTTPILLVSHAGYTDGAMHPDRQHTFESINEVQRQAFLFLMSQGISRLYWLSQEELGQDIDTTVDGTHPTDLGMYRYAKGYETMLRKILE